MIYNFIKRYICLLIPICLLAVESEAQNYPDGTTSPAGSITGAIAQPPEYQGDLEKNFIFQFTPMMPTGSQTDVVYGSVPVQTTCIYKDGFNRTFESIRHNFSTQDGQSRDLVSISDNRVQQDKHGFLSFTVTGDSNMTYSNGLPGAYQQQHDYYNSRYINEGYTPYSLTKYLSDANGRKKVDYLPGKSQVGQSRGTTTEAILNTANEVRIWTIDASGLPVTTSWYAANSLAGQRITGVTSSFNPPALAYGYTDKDRHVVLKAIREKQNPGYLPIYLFTYYVYDEMGRLCYTIPPKAVDTISANGWVVAADVLNNLCFQYRYDSKGRQSQVRQPGEQDFTDIVYDKANRVAMRRSALEKSQGVWEVSYYDQLGRIIATSLYTSSQTRDYWQNKVDNLAPANSADITWYFAGNSGEGVAPTETAVSGNTMMSYNYFDNYTIADPSNTVYNAAVAAASLGSDQVSGNGAEAPARSMRTQGLPVYTRARIMPAPGADGTNMGDWNANYIYYDDKGRPIYTCTKDLYQSAPVHTQYTGSQYDFLNRILITKHTLSNTKSVVSPAHNYIEMVRNEYDTRGRLLKQKHKVDSGPWKGQANYFYDDMGRISTKILGDGAERQDYTYNIRGQLQAINPTYTENAYQNDASRSFGEELAYDYGFSIPRYDGRISGMLWRGTGHTEHAYGYEYDELGRFTKAAYQERTNYLDGSALHTGPWNNTTSDYTVSGIFYDKNGNLLGMNQRGPGDDGNGNMVPVDMDKLTYSYESHSNRLVKVQDAIPDAIGYSFKDGTNGVLNDYSYDAAGNLTMDLNKGITSITYTWFNKPQVITYANGNKILYSYDAAGRKVQEKITESGITKVTAYIGNFVYQNDSLQYMLTPEGRTFFDLANSSNTEQFFVKDHLGNVRSVVETTPMPLLPYLATYELAAANIESLLFDKVGEIRDDKPGGGGDDTEAGKLDGSVDSLITGTSLMLKVMAGDEVELQTDNYYEDDYNNDALADDHNVMSDLITTLSGGLTAEAAREGITATTIQRGLSGANWGAFDSLVDHNTDTTRPRAYLNYMLFDSKMQLVTAASGAYQVNGKGDWNVTGTNGTPVKIPEDGFIFIFINNHSKKPVWFDKVQVLFHRGKLKEEDHYYPFGLPMANIGSTAAGTMPNRRKYQGNEFITEAGLNWMSFGARQYDPQTARFLSVDPLASAGGQDMISPYAAMGDQPVSMVDPGGMMPNSKMLMRMIGQGMNYTEGDLFNMQRSRWGGVIWIFGDVGDWTDGLSYGGLSLGGGGGGSGGLGDVLNSEARKTLAGTGMGSYDFTKDGYVKTSDNGTISNYIRWVQEGKDLSTLRADYALSADDEGTSLGWHFGGFESNFMGLDPFISHMNSTTTTLTSLYQYSTDMGPIWGSINRTVSGGVVSQNSNPNGYIQQNTTVNASGVSVGHSLSIGSTSNSVGLGVNDELGLFSVQPQATISGTNYHLNIGIGKYGLPSIGYGISTIDQNNLTESIDHTYDFGWWIFVPEIVQSVGGIGAMAF